METYKVYLYLYSIVFSITIIVGSVIYLSTDNIPKLSQIANNLVKQEDIECHRWWAPEVFEMERHTKTSDIWAFGVVMWEVATFGGLPYNYIHIKNIQEHTKFQW